MEICRLADKTFLATGGFSPFVVVNDEKDLLSFLSRFDEFYCLGNGSNVVASDFGVSLPVLRLGGKFRKFWFEGQDVIAGAGAQISSLIAASVKKSLGGIHKLSGIPATVGGAVYKNASAFGVSVGEKVKWIKVLRNGRIRTLSGKEIRFGYRRSSLLRSDVIIKVCLGLERRSREILEKEIARVKLERKKKGFSAPFVTGCVFENPEGDFAGRLIEISGCRSFSSGKVFISRRHANVLKALPGFSARDIFLLAERIRERVYEREGIYLKSLIEFWGNFL